MGVDDAWCWLRYPPGTALVGALAIGDDLERPPRAPTVRLGIRMIVWRRWREFPSFLKLY